MTLADFLIKDYDLYVKFARSILDNQDSTQYVHDVYLNLVRLNPEIDSNPRSYIRVAIRNAIYNANRKLSKESSVDLTRMQSNELSAENMLGNKEVAQQLREYLNLLGPKQRTTIMLKIYEDNSFDEIALITNTSYNTVKAGYRNALQKYVSNKDKIRNLL